MTLTTGQLTRNTPGVLITDTDTDLYDSTAHWRACALQGARHSGTRTDHPRSPDRTNL